MDKLSPALMKAIAVLVFELYKEYGEEYARKAARQLQTWMETAFPAMGAVISEFFDSIFQRINDLSDDSIDCEKFVIKSNVCDPCTTSDGEIDSDCDGDPDSTDPDKFNPYIYTGM